MAASWREGPGEQIDALHEWTTTLILEGKTALVTGASHGIGKAIALAFAQHGADVAITYRSRHDGAREVAAAIEALGRRAVILHAELSKAEDCVSIVNDAVGAMGKLDILVNNAAEARRGRLETLTLENWKYTFDTCVTAAFLSSQAAARHMIERGKGGSITNISTVHSSHVWFNDAPYGAAKAALNRLTMSMAVEWAAHAIRANCIAPGYINTAETADEKRRYDAGDQTAAPFIVAQRTASPAEMGGVAVFLASDMASYVTGQTIFADGGLLLPPVTIADYLRGDRSGAGFVG